MIKVDNVTKLYESFSAVKDASCTLKRNSIFGLVGHNGAGKTTLLKTICGIYKEDKGSITLDGNKIFENVNVKQKIFFLPDDVYILPQATMWSMSCFYKSYYPKWNDSAFHKLTEIFEIDQKKKLTKFSKGMQRQAFIIFALCASPDFLILDEAMDGIDPVKRELIRQLMLEAIAEKDMGILLSSHHLREMEDLCDRIGLMQNNTITFEKGVDEMREKAFKYRVALPEEVNFTNIDFPYKNLNVEGRIATFSAYGKIDAIEKSLQSLSPIFVETIPMTLEEIFLMEMEAKAYDFKGVL